MIGPYWSELDEEAKAVEREVQETATRAAAASLNELRKDVLL